MDIYSIWAKSKNNSLSKAKEIINEISKKEESTPFTPHVTLVTNIYSQEKADADYVRRSTGFAIGGVAPLGHKNKPLYFFDNTLVDFDEVWCAAGTPNSLFKLKTKDLLKVTEAKILNII